MLKVKGPGPYEVRRQCCMPHFICICHRIIAFNSDFYGFFRIREVLPY